MAKLNLDRATLAALFQNNHKAISAFEQVLGQVSTGIPSTVEEANALAGSALAVAQSAMASIAMLADAIELAESLPVPVPFDDQDDTAPRAHLGTLSAQNSDSVEITGGTMDNTPIGQSNPQTAAVTGLTVYQQITSTIGSGTAPFVVSSTDRVANLNVERAGLADSATKADAMNNPSTYPAAATDLPTVIALANALRTAAINKGL